MGVLAGGFGDGEADGETDGETDGEEDGEAVWEAGGSPDGPAAVDSEGSEGSEGDPGGGTEESGEAETGGDVEGVGRERGARAAAPGDGSAATILIFWACGDRSPASAYTPRPPAITTSPAPTATPAVLLVRSVPSTVWNSVVPAAGPGGSLSRNSRGSSAASAASLRRPRSSQSSPYPATAAVSSSATNPAAVDGRSAGSLAMPLAISVRTASGASSTGIGAFWCWYISTARSVARYGRCPVRHSKKTVVAA